MTKDKDLAAVFLALRSGDTKTFLEGLVYLKRQGHPQATDTLWDILPELAEWRRTLISEEKIEPGSNIYKEDTR